MTDDASIVAAKSCQVEAWARPAHDGEEYWVLPACNLAGDVELTVGGARVAPDSGDSSTVLALQAKTVLVPAEERAWAFAVSVATARDSLAPHGRSPFQTIVAKSLASWYPRRDVEVDLDVGASDTYDDGTFAVGGVALQYEIVDKLQVLVETYRDAPSRGKFQVGLRRELLPGALEVNGSYGSALGNASDWSVTVGILIQVGPLID